MKIKQFLPGIIACLFSFSACSKITMDFTVHAQVEPGQYWIEVVRPDAHPRLGYWDCRDDCNLIATINGNALPKRFVGHGPMYAKDIVSYLYQVFWKDVSITEPTYCIDVAISYWRNNLEPVGNYCGKTPASSAKCDFTQPSYLLDYGLVNASELNGMRADTPFTIECSKATTVTLTAKALDNSSRVNLAPQLNALLKIDGVRGDNGVVKTVDKTYSFTLSSEIQSSGAIPADNYQGSGVLEISYQ